MAASNFESTLYFDLHFKLVNNPEEIIAFLSQLENSQLDQFSFFAKIRFQSLVDIIGSNTHLNGKEAQFQKELDSMFDEIKLEIFRRLKVMIAFNRTNNLCMANWQKVKVFESLLIDLRQQGMFDMIKFFIEENKLNLGKRFRLEEKYKPFTPKLDDKTAKNHYKAELKPIDNQSLPTYIVWLNGLEQEKVFPKLIKMNGNKTRAFDALPDDLIVEKIIPKVIASNTLDFNTAGNNQSDFEDIFNLDNYHLQLSDEEVNRASV